MSIYGGITNQVVQRAQLAGNDMHLFLASLGFNLLVAVVIFFVFGGRSLLAQLPLEQERRAVDFVDGTPDSRSYLPAGAHSHRFDRAGVGALVFELNVGLVAISIAVVLTILFPKDQARAVDQIHWSTVLLICGVVTYIAVLQKAGAVTFVGDSVSKAWRTAPGCAASVLRRRNRLGIRIDGRRARRDHSAGCSLAVARTNRRRERRCRARDLILHRGCEPLLHQRRTGACERTWHRPGVAVPAALAVQRDRGRARPAACVGSARVAGLLGRSAASSVRWKCTIALS